MNRMSEPLLKLNQLPHQIQLQILLTVRQRQVFMIILPLQYDVLRILLGTVLVIFVGRLSRGRLRTVRRMTIFRPGFAGLHFVTINESEIAFT